MSWFVRWAYRSVSWSPDGEHIRALEGHESCVAGARELADGRLVTSTTNDFDANREGDSLRLWTAGGDFVTVLFDQGPVESVVELPDGSLLLRTELVRYWVQHLDGRCWGWQRPPAWSP